MLELKGKSGVIIDGKIIYCKKFTHSKTIYNYVESLGVKDEDKFVNDRVIIFNGKYLYTMDYRRIDEVCDNTLSVIKNSDFNDWLLELN